MKVLTEKLANNKFRAIVVFGNLHIDGYVDNIIEADNTDAIDLVVCELYAGALKADWKNATHAA